MLAMRNYMYNINHSIVMRHGVVQSVQFGVWIKLLLQMHMNLEAEQHIEVLVSE